MNYDQMVYDNAISEGFNPQIAKYIVAQARLESADYDSSVFHCNNNLNGMKFIGQPNAIRGTIAPSDEISIGCHRIIGAGCNRTGDAGCKNGDYYAKFPDPIYSAKDAISRLYKKTINGITFDDLNNSTDVLDFAIKLKKRGYYGFHNYNTSLGKAEAKDYAAGLKAKLIKVSVIEFYNQNKKAINITLILFLVAGIGGYAYYLKKKKIW